MKDYFAEEIDTTQNAQGDFFDKEVDFSPSIEPTIPDYMKSKWYSDAASESYSGYGLAALNGTMSKDAAIIQGNASKEKLLQEGGNYKDVGFLAHPVMSVSGETSQVARYMSQNMLNRATSGLAGGVAFGTIAAIAGTPAAAPAGFAAGFAVFQQYGGLKYTMDREAGETYLDLMQEGVDEKIARPIALAKGLVNSLLDNMSLGVTFKPVIDKFRGTIVDKGVQSLLKTFVKQYAKSMGTELTTEELQNTMDLWSKVAARTLDKGKPLTREEMGEVMSEWGQQTVDTASKVAQGMTLFAGIGAGVKTKTQSKINNAFRKTTEVRNALAKESEGVPLTPAEKTALDEFKGAEKKEGQITVVEPDAEAVAEESEMQQDVAEIESTSAPEVTQQTPEQAEVLGKPLTAEEAVKRGMSAEEYVASKDLGGKIAPFGGDAQSEIKATIDGRKPFTQVSDLDLIDSFGNNWRSELKSLGFDYEVFDDGFGGNTVYFGKKGSGVKEKSLEVEEINSTLSDKGERRLGELFGYSENDINAFLKQSQLTAEFNAAKEQGVVQEQVTDEQYDAIEEKAETVEIEADGEKLLIEYKPKFIKGEGFIVYTKRSADLLLNKAKEFAKEPTSYAKKVIDAVKKKLDKEAGLSVAKKSIRETTGQVKDQTKVATYRQVLKEVEKAASTASKFTRKLIGDLQTRVVGIIDEAGIELKDSERLKKRILNIPSKREDIAKTFIEVTDELNKMLPSLTEKANVNKLKTVISKITNRVKKSKSISLDIKDKIDELVEAGGDFGLISSDALAKVANELIALEKEGRKIFADKKQALADRKAAVINAVSESKGLSYPTKVKANLTGKDSFLQDFWTNVRSAQRKATKTLRSITPMAVILDQMDGGMKYNGAFVKTIYDRHFQNVMSWKLKTDAYKDSLMNVVKKYELGKSSSDKVGIYLLLQREGGKQRLINAGYTQKDLDITLTEGEAEAAEIIRTVFDALWYPLSRVSRDVFNKRLGKVDNYFSFFIDYEDVLNQRVEGPQNDMPVSKTHASFLEALQNGEGTVKTDAFTIFENYVNRALYIIETSEDLEFIKNLTNDGEFVESAGDLGTEIIKDWLQVQFNMGMTKRTAFVDSFRRNVGVFQLGFKASSIVIQVTSLFDGAALVGPKVFQYYGTSWKFGDPKVKFVMENMHIVRNRVGGEVSLIDYQNRGWQNTAMEPMKFMDKRSAFAVALAAYEKWHTDRGLTPNWNTPNQEAVRWAEFMTERTQASAGFWAAPLALTSGGFTGNAAIDKMLFQFQTFVLNRWSVISHDLIGSGLFGEKADAKEAAAGIFWMSSAYVAESLLRTATSASLDALLGKKSKHDDDEFLEQMIMSSIQTVPFVGMVAGSLKYGSTPIPTAAFLQRITEYWMRVKKQKNLTKKNIQALQAIVMMAGAGIPIPGSMINDIIKRLEEK